MMSPFADLNAAFLFGMVCGMILTTVSFIVAWNLTKEAR